MKVILIFVDGIGLERGSSANPLSEVKMPGLRAILGGPLTTASAGRGPYMDLQALDATLGVDGIPQSATGQTALFTGRNAARHIGGHLPAYPNEELIALIRSHAILKQISDAGGKASFANAYRSAYFSKADTPYSVTTHCVLAAGLQFRLLDALAEGNAVYWDFTNARLAQQTEFEIPVISPYEAGANLARIGSAHHLTVFESFESDFIGHQRDHLKAKRFLGELDWFIQGCIAHMDREMTLLLTSDHGNLEDLSHGGHTRNPVPLLTFGRDREYFSGARSILDITPMLRRLFHARA